MKKTFIFMILMCGVLFTGCSSLVKLTDDESNKLTEYMAGVVLKHADDYKDGLLTMDEVETIEEKQEARRIKLDENNNSITNEVNVVKDSASPINLSSSSNGQNKSVTKLVSLTKAVGKGDFSINYKKYELYDKYVSGDATKITLEPRENKKILVLYFDVKNLSDKSLKLDLVEEGIGYQITLDSGKTLKPLLTLLMNDIQYINLDIAANLTSEAVIAFEVDKNVELSNSTLTVTRKENTSIVDLK